MVPRATQPKGGFFSRTVCAPTWLMVLAVLLMSSSLEALAQESVQARYEQLKESAETAKERYAVNPTGRSLEVMNRAVDEFRRYEQDNSATLRLVRPGDVGAARTLATGGPDGFGYTFIDDTEPGGPIFSWIDISTTGVLIASGDDVSSGPVALGAPFGFYTQTYTQVVAATNGYLSLFDAADGGPDLSNDCPLPATPSTPGGTPGARMYPLHDDLISNIWHEYFAFCPHPNVLGGCDVFHYDSDHFAGSGPFEFEVILNNATGDFLYQYLDTGNNNTEAGSGSTTGIQNRVNVEAPIGLTYACNAGGTVPGPGDPALAILWEFPDLTTADLEVTKTVDNATPEVGDVIEYWIDVTNLQGGSTVARVIDKLPAGVTYVSHTASQGTYDPNTGFWEISTVAIGSSVSLHIEVVVNTPAPVTNTAFIGFSTLPDPDKTNNRASVTVNPISADLSLRKEVTAFGVEDGVATATYKVTVTNSGPNDVCGVEVEDQLSADMTVVGLSTTQGTVTGVGTGTLTWDVGCIDVGDNAMLTLTVEVPEGGSLLNVAEVTDSGLPDPDSTPGDGEGDDFSATIAGFRDNPDFVRGVGPGGIVSRGGERFFADVAVTKTVDNSTPAVGQNVTYTLTASNSGPQSTAGVEVTDHLPACLALVSTDPAGVYDGWVWTVGKLTVGQSKTLKITATVTAACQGTVVNVAEVTASNLPDPDDRFNRFRDPLPNDGKSEASFTVSASTAKAAGETKLMANYPNPFNPVTVVPFELAEATQVSVKVYDLLGRLVETLVDGELSAGTYEISFRASGLPTGVYLIRMEAAGQVYTQRITLMK